MGTVPWIGWRLQCVDEHLSVQSITGSEHYQGNGVQYGLLPLHDSIPIPATQPGETVRLSVQLRAPDYPWDVQGFYLRAPATLERVEISKGRNSVVTGAGSPSSSANYVSKKPTFKQRRNISLGTGTPQQLHALLDINQALSHPN